jgi:phytoene dehydrogenase-like protein
MDGYESGSGTFRINVALSELPNFTALPGIDVAEYHQSGIIIGSTMDYMDRAYIDAKQYGWSRQSFVEMLIPSILDDSLAPPGQHVASLFCQQFAPTLPDGRSWQDARIEAADCIINSVNAYAPNFKASILGRMILSPLDLEQKLGLIGSDIMHGQMTLDQMWAARPIMNYGDYRGLLKSLYMCGAGTHPGGGVTGLPGKNAAREILKDR